MAKTANQIRNHTVTSPADYAAIGEMLRDARLSHEITLEQVAATLHIKPAIVEALEKGRLEDIAGGAVYAKGHLRSYAQFLGIDLASMLKLLATDAAPRPLASVSSAHNEPRRAVIAAALSLLALLVVGGAWYAKSVKTRGPEVVLVKPVPEDLNNYLNAMESVGLSSPCIKDAAHVGWPSCYSEAQENAMARFLPQYLRSVMQVQ